MIMNPHLLYSAYHEAGHVVRAAAWGQPIITVSIEPDPNGQRFGFTERVRTPFAECAMAQLLAEICIALAGEAAEYHVRRGRRADLDEVSRAELAVVCRGDHANVREAIQWIPPDEHPLLDEWIPREVDDWIERPEVWREVCHISQALLRYTTIGGLQLRCLLNQRAAGAVRIEESEGATR